MRSIWVVFFLKAMPLILLAATRSYSQVSWSINTLGGYNFASASRVIDKNDLLLSFDGEFEYNYEQENREASFLIRVKPELYGIHNNLKTLKLKAKGNYFQKEENFNWGINLTRQHNIYDSKDINLYYDIFILNAEASLFIIYNTPFTINLGYAYQTAKDAFEQNLDLLFLDSKLFTRFGYFKMGYGLYLERFDVVYEQHKSFDYKNTNNGWRIGPQILLAYLRNWTVRFEYRFLIHDSPLTQSFSYDQWLRLLAGKFIFDNLSAFVLVDYYSRNYKLKMSAADILPLLYSPIDQENNLYLKVEYDLSEMFSVYIRSGYSKENFFVNDLSYSGWTVLLGLSVGN